MMKTAQAIFLLLMSAVLVQTTTAQTTANAKQSADTVSTREMDRINWMEFREIVPARVQTVLLPTGTLEPHGVVNNRSPSRAASRNARTP
jgi:xanthine/uracil/vitamin C permease (AzgA family)